MSENLALPGIHPQDPSGRKPDHLDRIEDAINYRSQETAILCPAAHALEARLLLRGAEQIHGEMSLHCGQRAPEHYRAAWRGERHIWLTDLCHLAVSLRPAARSAVRAMVIDLLHTVDEQSTGGSLASHIADLAEAATRLVSDLARAQADGTVDQSERDGLRRVAVDCQRALAAVEGVLREGGR